MRKVSTEFRQDLRGIRQLNAIITYKDDKGFYVLSTENKEDLETELGDLLVTEKGIIELYGEDIISVNPIFNVNLYKTICKTVEIESLKDIIVGKNINVKIGVKLNSKDDKYEYVNYGEYIVKESLFQADTNSYLITAYDKMMESMISYDDNLLSITFPIKHKDFVIAICNKFGWDYEIGTYPNFDKIISKDLYAGENLTYRDVLDDLCQVTGRNLMFDNENKLILKEDSKATYFKEETGTKVLNLSSVIESNANSYIVFGNGIQDTVGVRDSYGNWIIGKIKNIDGEERIFKLNLNKDNLFDINTVSFGSMGIDGVFYDEGVSEYTKGSDYLTFYPQENEAGIISDYIETDELKEYILSCESDYNFMNYIAYNYDKDYNYIGTSEIGRSIPYSFSALQNTKYIRIGIVISKFQADLAVTVTNIKLYDGIDPNPYYELCGDGNISDEIDIVTGKLIKRISKTSTGYKEIEPKIIQFTPTEVALFDGENNIELETNIDTTTKITYSYEMFTITDEDLKDVNVNFEEKYGAVNTLTITTNDNVVINSIEDKEAVAKNGKIEFNINDNFLLNYDSDTFIEELFNEINGLQYYTYDFDTIGLLVLEPLDRFLVNHNEQNYECLMLNDDVKLTQGLIETSYAEKPDEAEKDYKTTDRDKNKLNNAIISLNKANAEIQLNTNAIDKANASITLNSKAIDTANSQIVLKANAQGKIVQAKLEADASTGSTFTIDADQINLTANDILNLIAGNEINLTSKNITINSTNFKVDKDGNMAANNGTFNGGEINMVSPNSNPKNKLTGKAYNNKDSTMELICDGFNVYDENNNLLTYLHTADSIVDSNNYSASILELLDYSGEDTSISPGSVDVLQKNGYSGSVTSGTYINAYGIETPRLIQTSLKENKKNFEKYENALQELDKIDIYKYNLKSESDNEKKHLGFVIGDDFNYSKIVTSGDNKGVDNYSFTSLCFQMIKEQQKQIEELKKDIEKLKEVEK